VWVASRADDAIIAHPPQALGRPAGPQRLRPSAGAERASPSPCSTDFGDAPLGPLSKGLVAGLASGGHEGPEVHEHYYRRGQEREQETGVVDFLSTALRVTPSRRFFRHRPLPSQSRPARSLERNTGPPANRHWYYGSLVGQGLAFSRHRTAPYVETGRSPIASTRSDRILKVVMRRVEARSPGTTWLVPTGIGRGGTVLPAAREEP
jgi:hypothetical protein